MEMFEQIWFWVATAVTVIAIPLIDSLLKDADPQKVQRWSIVKQVFLRIFPTRTTESSKTGTRKVSLPGASAVHPDDRTPA